MKSSTRELCKELPPGYTIEGLHGGHLYVLRPDRTPLRDSSGVPVRVVNSPSDRRSLLKSRARIRRALRDADA